MAPLVWLVTGTTSGIGAALVQDIVGRGDKVIATGRNVESKIGHLKSDSIAILELDVGGDETEVKAKIREAWGIFGHIDVVVNNAGVVGSRTVEDAEDDFIQHIFTVNCFGPMRIAQAVIPLFRQQGNGSLVFVSTSATNNPLPFQVHYGASKAALTNWVYGLSAEVRGFGIKCVVIEPGGFKTQLGQPREGVRGGEGIGVLPGPSYKPLYDEFIGALSSDPDLFLVGDPSRGAKAIVDSVRLEGLAAGKSFPLHLSLGSDSHGSAKRKAEVRLKGLQEWEAVSKSTDRDGASDAGMHILFKLSAGFEE